MINEFTERSRSKQKHKHNMMLAPFRVADTGILRLCSGSLPPSQSISKKYFHEK